MQLACVNIATEFGSIKVLWFVKYTFKMAKTREHVSRASNIFQELQMSWSNTVKVNVTNSSSTK